MTAYANVIVDVTASAVDRCFVYELPFEAQLGDRVLVPFGPRKIEGFIIELCDETDFPKEKIKPVIKRLDDEPVVLPWAIELAKWMAKKYRCCLVDCLRLMIPAQMRGNRVAALTKKFVRLLRDDWQESDFKRAPRQWETVQTLKKQGETPLAQLESGAVNALVKKGAVQVYDRRIRRVPAAAAQTVRETLLIPTHEQQTVIDEISEAIRGEGGRFLLHGVTGSGKTEVYCHLVKQALDLGKQAIVLVPEIALTPQMVDWFVKKFGNTAAVLHSRLSAGERFDEWWRIRTGEARVVVGARSAVFAPVDHVGLIVVDEEHETSYQSEHVPKYDVREVAAQICLREKATLVLGSATPQIKTYHNALRGYYSLLEMRSRVGGRPLPQVEIVDMRQELVKGNRSIFSVPLVKALRECFDQDEQAILFLNRRGYHTFVSCRNCGKTVKCPQCDVSMTYHLRDGRLRCHYCGYETVPPKTCPSCASSLIRYFGSGTERVQNELEELFPGIPVSRMDADTTAGKDGHQKILEEFRSGRTRMLVGTQMIAKGHDFPKVTVVGVISADMMLSYPDYRSAERAFCMLTQVEGRAGRGNVPGKVFVQTYQPEHYAITFAARQDYRAFYNEEIQNRRRGLFPPYTVYARLVFSSSSRESAASAANDAREAFEKTLYERPNLKAALLHYRTMEAPIALLRGQYRWQLFFKLLARDAEPALDVISALADRPYENVEVEFEINPNNVL